MTVFRWGMVVSRCVLALAVLTACSLISTARADARELSAQETRLLCSGLGSTLGASDDTSLKLDNGRLKASTSSGTLTVYQGDDLVIEIEDFSYQTYVECVDRLLNGANTDEFPAIRGGFLHAHGFDPANAALIEFLRLNENRVVFLDLFVLRSLEIFEDYISDAICFHDADRQNQHELAFPIAPFSDLAALMEEKTYGGIDEFLAGFDDHYINDVQYKRCSPLLVFTDQTEFGHAANKGDTVTGFFRVEIPSSMAFGHREAIRLNWLEASAEEWRRALE